MYYIDIKDALYFIVICVVALEILGKMACFIDSKQPINRHSQSFTFSLIKLPCYYYRFPRNKAEILVFMEMAD